DLGVRAAEGIRAGSRVRRRRRLWGALTTSAAVVAIGALGAQLNLSVGSNSPSPGLASAPTSTTSPSSSASPSPCFAAAGSGHGPAVPSADPGSVSKAAKERLARQYQRLRSASSLAACKKGMRNAPLTSGKSAVEHLPVALVAAGWTCGP